jgi:hypothetical protein
MSKVLSVPQWAGFAGLAEVPAGQGPRLVNDITSIVMVRRLLATGLGPKMTEFHRRTSNGTVTVSGISVSDHEAWTRSRPWASYLAACGTSERGKIMHIVGDADYASVLYKRYSASRWCHQMTFVCWLKRRQRLKDRHSPRKSRRGGSSTS